MKIYVYMNLKFIDVDVSWFILVFLLGYVFVINK